MTERQIVTERLTVGLIQKASADLATLRDTTGLNKGDVINRAVSLYAFVQAQLDSGHDLLVRSATGEVEKVHLL